MNFTPNHIFVAFMLGPGTDRALCAVASPIWSAIIEPSSSTHHSLRNLFVRRKNNNYSLRIFQKKGNVTVVFGRDIAGAGNKVCLQKIQYFEMTDESLCRLCLKMTNEAVGLFEIKNGVPIVELIKVLIPIEIEHDEGPQLPQNCCVECLELIVDATHLRDVALMNDYELRSGLQTEENLKVEIVDDFMVEALDENLIQFEEDPVSPSYSIEVIDTTVLTVKRQAFCDLCKVNFATAGSLKRHQLRKHGGNFECDYCGMSVKTKHDLTRHLEKLHKVKMRDRSVISTQQIDIDIENMCEKLPAPLPMSCTFCSYTDHSEEGINEHLQIHRDVVESGKMYCSLCPSPITSMEGLFEHTRRHNEKIKTHKCLVCDKSFPYDEKFINHLRTHKKNRNKICFCPECGRKFTKPTLLEDHIRFIHKKEALFCCFQCGQGFGSKSALNGHVKRHLEGQKYQCPFCPKAFSSHNLLNSHKNVHSADRVSDNAVLDREAYSYLPFQPYACTQCDKRFKHQKVLSDHLKRHDGARQIHLCAICDRALYSSYALTRHMLVHTGSKPHQCEYCNKSYAQKNGG